MVTVHSRKADRQRGRTSVLDAVYGVDPARDAVAGAVAGLDWLILDPDCSRSSSGRVRGGAPRWSLVASPGHVQVVSGVGRGWVRDRHVSAVQDAALAALESARRRLDRLDVRLAGDLHEQGGRWFGDEWDYFAEREEAAEALARARDALGVTACKRRSVVRSWSRKSRTRMVRRLASLDWTPMRAQGRLAMVTLTYPGDWLRYAPDAATVKRHLKSWRSALERQYGQRCAVWKLEFQARGAPHFHVLLAVPNGVPLRDFREWVGRTWSRSVGAPARVGVDVSFGARATDPQRVATYFAKHAAPAAGSKEYQHQPPAQWVDADEECSVGRFWGYWRLVAVEVEAEVPREAAVEAARVLRGWVRAQGRTRKVKRRRVRRSTGTITTRWQTERYDVRALSFAQPGGFVLANDGVTLMAAVARAVVADAPDWPPGQRRPLP